MADAAGTALLSHHALRRRASCRGLECVPAREHGGVTFSLEPPGEEEGKAPRHHAADGCFLCRRPLRAASDVFMYRGDTPFCSEECRQEQIELDEAREWETMYRRRRHHHHHHHREASVKRVPPASAQQELYPRASDGILAG